MLPGDCLSKTQCKLCWRTTLHTMTLGACALCLPLLVGCFEECMLNAFSTVSGDDFCVYCAAQIRAKPTAPAHEDTALASSPKSIAIRHFSSLQNKEPREYLESQGILMATTETSASSACHLHRKTCHLVILLRSSIQKLGRSYDCTLPVNNSIKPPSLGNSRKLFPMFSSPAFYSNGFIIEEKKCIAVAELQFPIQLACWLAEEVRRFPELMSWWNKTGGLCGLCLSGTPAMKLGDFFWMQISGSNWAINGCDPALCKSIDCLATQNRALQIGVVHGFMVIFLHDQPLQWISKRAAPNLSTQSGSGSGFQLWTLWNRAEQKSGRL